MFDAVEMAEQSRKAAGTDVSLASDAELLAAAAVLEGKRASDEAARGHVLAELELRGLCDREFGLTTASWLAHATPGSRAAIAGQVKDAVKLRRLGVVDDALSGGRISPEHARALVGVTNPRIEADLDDLQDDLVELAQQCPFPAWRRQVTELAELLDQDGGYDPARDLARNHLRVSPNASDGISVSGELVGDYAVAFTGLLDAETDRHWRRFRSDHEACPELEVPSRSTLRALALVELIRKGAAGSAPTGAVPVVDVSLVIHASDAATEDTAVRIVTPDGLIMTRDVARHLCCDAAVTPLWIDDRRPPDAACAFPACDKPVILAMGRETRLASRAQRRALAARDGCCVFPGCDMPTSWCDAHHVIAWEAGGDTDMENLALLCRYHHGVSHRRRWAMTANVDQTFTWTTPTGRILQSQRNRGGSGP